MKSLAKPGLRHWYSQENVPHYTSAATNMNRYCCRIVNRLLHRALVIQVSPPSALTAATQRPSSRLTCTIVAQTGHGAYS